MAITSEGDNMTKEVKSKTPIIATAVGVVALVVGYILGATIGFGKIGGKPSYVGTYTYDKWNGNQQVSLTLNDDGTCKRPSYGNDPCTYEVKGNQVYFNGEGYSYATVGETGIVYHDSLFIKLK